MTSSGTYNFNPSVGELVLYAYNLCEVRPTALTQEHMQQARIAANLMAGTWSADGLNLWKVELVTVPLVTGTATYAVSPSVVAMLDGFITQGSGATAFDRYLLPVSRTEYATYANKQQQGAPTVYWFDRLLSPTVTLWPVPDGQYATFSYYCYQQVQDVALTSGQTMDVPEYFMEAAALGLAYRLAMAWKPEKYQMLKAEGMEVWNTAKRQNVETANLYISPTLSSYWRV